MNPIFCPLLFQFAMPSRIQMRPQTRGEPESLGVCCAVLCYECAPVCFVGPASLQVKMDQKQKHPHGNFKPIFEAICSNLICNSRTCQWIQKKTNISDCPQAHVPSNIRVLKCPKTCRNIPSSQGYIIKTKHHNIMFH